MPDVGVLELQIKDNGKEAGSGLSSLARALKSVQTNLGTGLDLSNVSRQVVNLAQTINSTKGTSTIVKNLGTLFNSLVRFNNVKNFKIDTTPFEKLKTAIGDGLNIGTAGTQVNALRTALTEGWGDGSGIASIKELHNAAKSTGDKDAANIRTMASAVREYAKSIEELKKATTGAGDWRMMMGGITTSIMKDTVRPGSVMKANLTQFGNGIIEESQNIADNAVQPIREGFEKVESTVSSATESMKEFVNTASTAKTQSYAIEKLMKSLDIGNKYSTKGTKGFSNVVDAMTGVTRNTNNLASEAAKAFDDKFFEQIDRVDNFMTSLDKPRDVAWPNEMFDKVMGIGQVMDKVSDETNSMFNVPAMNKEGPFKYAYEEIQHYSELLNQAKSNMENWETEYKRIQNLVKYNGANEERTAGLKTAEEGWYKEYEDVQKYQEALAGIIKYANEYSGTMTAVTQATQEQAAAVREIKTVTDDADKLANRLQNIVTIAESWKDMSKDDKGLLFDVHKRDDLTSGILEKLQNLKGDNLDLFTEKIKEIVSSSVEGTEKVAQLQDMLKNFDVGMESVNGVTDSTDALTRSANGAKTAFDEAAKSVNNYANSVHGVNGLSTLAESSMGEVERLSSMSDIDLLTMKLDALKYSLAEEISTGRLDAQQMADRAMRIKDLTAKIEELKSAQDELNNDIKAGQSGWGSFMSGLKKAFPLIEKIRNQFSRILMRRALTAVIRSIASGFKEGMQNVYEYSKAVGTSFAPAMDSAASALLTMKNSLGAAVAPLLQSLIPVLNTVVNWFVTLVNYVNQFISLLRGQSAWTHAVEASTSAFNDNAQAAHNAAKESKELLADWDELNIIQSNSNGGGSGSGGGKPKPDYENMFEEITEFDQRIKDIVAFIDEHMGGIFSLAKKIGIAILGWKLSKAFKGLLGELGRLAAGITLSIIGFELSYGAGYDAGLKGEYGLQEIIESALGAVASAFGGYLIFGPAGIIIGLGVSALVNFLGYKMGEAERLDIEKWGTLHLTAEEIAKYVRDQFTFDVDATVDIIKNHIEHEREARTSLNTKIDNFSKSLDEAKANVALNVDSDITSLSIRQASADALDAIGAVQELINASGVGLELTFKEFNFKDSEGNDISDDILSSVKIADTELRDYFTGIGEKISELILEGERTGWANGEAEQALALMESQKRIYDRAAEIREEMETESKIRQSVQGSVKDGVIDRETALAAVEEQKAILQEVKDTTEEQKRELASNYFELASLAQAAAEEAGLDTETGYRLKLAADRYTYAANEIIDGMGQAVDDKLAETKRKMAEAWIETLKVVYGEDFATNVTAATDEQGSVFEFLDNMFGVGRSTENKIRQLVKENGVDAAAEYIKQSIAESLIGSDPNGIVQYVLENLGGDPMDFLSEELKDQVIRNIIKNSDNDGIAFALVHSLFDLDKSQLIQYFDPELVTEKLNEIAQEQIMDAIENEKEVVLEGSGLVVDMTNFSIETPDIQLDDYFEEEVDIHDLIPDIDEDNKIHITIVPEIDTEEEVDIWDLTGKNGISGRINPNNLVATGMYSDIGNGSNHVTHVETDLSGQSQQSMETAVQKGSKSANATQEQLLQQAVNYLMRLVNKEWTLNVNPSSAWGGHYATSGREYERVTGETFNV